MTMTNAPYNRQGEALDPALGVNGNWIDYGAAFLVTPPHDKSAVAVKLPSGETAIGINAAELASSYHMPIEALFEHNKNKALSYHFEELTPERRAIKLAREYVFELPGIGEASRTVNITQVLGA
jgi:hypothetical protein